MKHIFYIISIAAAVLLSFPGVAGEVIEKKKTVSETYQVSAADKISVTNSFGQVKLNTWNKKEVKVDITIVGRSASESGAQELLDKIKIEHGKNSSGVFFRTKMEQLHTKNNGNKNKGYKEEGVEINYIVYLPDQNPIDISNSFGALEIGDFSGNAVLESKFGSLTAGNLSNVKKLLVEFGKADVKSIHNGELTIKFSKANIEKLSGNIQSNLEFCEAVDIRVDNTLKQFDLKSSYSTVAVVLDKSLSADFDIKTSFGEMNNSSTFDISEKKQDTKGPVFDRSYHGTAGNGAARVTIKSSFGNIKFK